MLNRARSFFHHKEVMEVDCPSLSSSSSVDLHIDVMKVALKGNQIGYLHTSAEYGMKRLLSMGIGDIYQISHVFRDGEIGPLHNPEFTMVEWYRIGFAFEQMIQETLDFIRQFLGNLETQILTYRQTFQQFLQIDYTTATSYDLLHCAKAHRIDLPQDAKTWDKDTLLQLLMSLVIEPQLGKKALFVLSNFPSSQAALSQTLQLPSGESVASRFEVYYQGIELANGYHELSDATEQKRRLEASNEARLNAGKESLKIDENFLEALKTGLPDCCGVAVGFDRLMMLKHQQATLRHILPFIWEES